MEKVWTGSTTETGIRNTVSGLPRIRRIQGFFLDVESGVIINYTAEKEACLIDEQERLYIVTGYSQEYGTNQILVESMIVQEMEEKPW